MNEYSVLKNSIKIAVVGLVIFGIVAIFTKEVSYLFGYVLGYIVGILTYLIIIQSSTTILNLQGGSIAIVMAMFMVKLLLYALGFFLAVKLPNIFNLISVCIGYFIIKITIYTEGFKNKGGELHG